MKTKMVYTFFRSINLWRHPWNKCRPKTTKSQLIRKTKSAKIQKSATGAKGGKKGTGKHVTTGLGFVFDWLKKYLCSDWLEHCMSLINTNAKFMPNHERPSIWFVQTKQLCSTGDLPYLFCWQFKEVYGFCFVLLNSMTLLIKKYSETSEPSCYKERYVTSSTHRRMTGRQHMKRRIFILCEYFLRQTNIQFFLLYKTVLPMTTCLTTVTL